MIGGEGRKLDVLDLDDDGLDTDEAEADESIRAEEEERMEQ